MKVLFYTSIPRMFRSTLIGYLHEISQVYPVVLLSEELDKQTQAVLQDTKLFPKLEAIVPVSQYPSVRVNMFAQNRYLAKKAKEVVKRYNPDIVIMANDVYPFELYLQRAAKRRGAQTMCFQGGYRIAGKEELKTWDRILGNKPLRTLKKQIGHMVYYWVFPLLVGELPFRGKSSFVRLEDDTGFRADWSVVFSQRDYDICVQEGIPKEKLLILGHPLCRASKKVFEAAQREHSVQPSRHATVLLPSEEVGVRKKDLSLISSEEIWTTRKSIIGVLSKVLRGWPIWVKPHPATEDLARARKEFEPIASSVRVADASEPAEKYIAQSKIVVGIPTDSTALFTASLQSSETVVISADLHGELLGDSFRNSENVEYVHDLGQLKELLQRVRDGAYEKRTPTLPINSFHNAAEVISYAWQHIHG